MYIYLSHLFYYHIFEIDQIQHRGYIINAFCRCVKKDLTHAIGLQLPCIKCMAVSFFTPSLLHLLSMRCRMYAAALA